MRCVSYELLSDTKHDINNTTHYRTKRTKLRIILLSSLTHIVRSGVFLKCLYNYIKLSLHAFIFKNFFYALETTKNPASCDAIVAANEVSKDPKSL